MEKGKVLWNVGVVCLETIDTRDFFVRGVKVGLGYLGVLKGISRHAIDPIFEEMGCPEYKYELPSGCPEKMFSYGYEEGKYGSDFYRIAKNDPPKKEDFVPHYFLKRMQKLRENFKKSRKEIDLCRMAGLSILQNRDETIRLMKKYPQLGRYVWKGTIEKHHGLLLRTPSRDWPSHHTFYVCKGVEEEAIFNKKVNLNDERNGCFTE